MMDPQAIASDLAGWSLRACALASVAGVAMWALRVRDVSARLAVWTAVLVGALAMPLVSAVAPSLELPIPYVDNSAPAKAAAAVETIYVMQQTAAATVVPEPARSTRRMDWPLMFVAVWISVAFAMLSQLAVGVWYGRRLLRAARPVQADAAARVYESDALRVPVTMGSVRPAIVLPLSWRLWDGAKLRAVLAHESAHVKRRDPLRLFAASVYRAVFWFHPLAWWLHRRIADLAEAASDDAALAASNDGAHYAEVLLSFFAAAPRRVQWDAVAMATRGKATKRMVRILDNGRKLSTGISPRALAAITVFAAGAAWLAASASPVWAVISDQDPPAAPAPPPAPAPPAAGVPGGVAGGIRGGIPGGIEGGIYAPAPPMPPQPMMPPAPANAPMALAGGAVAAQPAMPGMAPYPPPPPADAPMAIDAMAAQAPPPPPAPPAPVRWTHEGGDFAIMGPENSMMMGSFSPGDNERIRTIQRQAGGDILWFRRDSGEYVVRDPALVKQAREAFAAMHDYGRQMGEQGRKQGEQARRQAQEVRERMWAPRTEMAQLSAEMSRISSQMVRVAGNEAEMARLESRLHELEKDMHDRSAKLAEVEKQMRSADSEMRQTEQKLRAEMEAMSRQMQERSSDAQRKLKAIEDEAIRSKKAEKLL